jgi:hypothetical protein
MSSDIYFERIKIWDDERIIVFRRGEIVTPLFIFDKDDVRKFKELIEKEKGV